MISLILIWWSLGFIGYILDCYNLYRVEKVINCKFNFINSYFLKLNIYKIPFGPFYLFSSLLYMILNREEVENAYKYKIKGEKRLEEIVKLKNSLEYTTSIMNKINDLDTILNKQSNEVIDSIIFNYSKQNEYNKNKLNEIEIVNPIESLNRILDEIDEDESK